MKKKIKEVIVVEGKTDTAIIQKLFDADTIETHGLALDEALDLVFADQYVDIAPSSNYGTVDTFRVSEIALASSIAIICASIYLMIRFGLSRGLAALLISFVTSGFALSIFAMIRIQFISSRY